MHLVRVPFVANEHGHRGLNYLRLRWRSGAVVVGNVELTAPNLMAAGLLLRDGEKGLEREPL
jgi:hypothetical protein